MPRFRAAAAHPLSNIGKAISSDADEWTNRCTGAGRGSLETGGRSASIYHNGGWMEHSNVRQSAMNEFYT
jgi:hypothetical protein